MSSIKGLCTATRSDRGFTLIELMVVALVITILLAVAMATFYSTTASANAAACRHNQRTLNDASAIAHCTVDVALLDELSDLSPYVKNYSSVCTCPADGTPLLFNAATGEVTCPNHP